MDNTIIEASYPISFREEDAKELGSHIRMRHPVQLVGMKRVGISNFLRFFLYHKDIVTTHISESEQHIFLPVDLNDLIERELFPFWILTFKRLVDTTEISITLSSETKKEISDLFVEAIQSRDTFLTIEALRKALQIIARNNMLPTIFFIRFDRIKDSLNKEFFNNLEGLREATGHKLSYVFTSFRTLEDITPDFLPGKSISNLSSLYLKPATKDDMRIIFDTLENYYNVSPSPEILEKIVDASGGHVQYLQLALIILNHKNRSNNGEVITPETLLEILLKDERMSLQSEEIWESLTDTEKEILIKIRSHGEILDTDKSRASYLWDTGFVKDNNHIFSYFFENYIQQKDVKKVQDETIDFTKKEFALFKLLSENMNEIVEREQIISTVWPEVEAFGVSDWTIDRLVARLRTKLKKQSSKNAIVTVKTRGYKLIEEAI